MTNTVIELCGAFPTTGQRSSVACQLRPDHDPLPVADGHWYIRCRHGQPAVDLCMYCIPTVCGDCGVVAACEVMHGLGRERWKCTPCRDAWEAANFATEKMEEAWRRD